MIDAIREAARKQLDEMAAGERYGAQPRPAPITGPGYTIGRARYAKGMLAVRAPSTDGYLSPAGWVMNREINARWSNRERAWIASPSKVARFLEIMRSNENA